MEGKFQVSFDDKTYETVVASDATAAKGVARIKRIQALDPSGQMNRADLMGHASVKIAKVVEVTVAVLVAIGSLALLYLLQQLDAWTAARMGHVAHAGVLDLIGTSGTAITSTISALAAVTGDSLVVPFFPESKKAWLLQIWNDSQTAGTLRVRSGKMHDNVSGIRVDTLASDLYPLLPWGARQHLESGDTLNVDLAGSGTAGDIEYVMLLRYFEELSAQHSRLITHDEALKRTKDIHANENTIATGATAAWAGSEAINVEIDQLHARSDYALLGYLVDTECPAVAWRGPDTANVRVGGPGIETDRNMTQDWFLRLSRMYAMALVPVINADNKSATNIDALQDENGADVTVISIYAELSK